MLKQINAFNIPLLTYIFTIKYLTRDLDVLEYQEAAVNF